MNMFTRLNVIHMTSLFFHPSLLQKIALMSRGIAHISFLVFSCASVLFLNGKMIPMPETHLTVIFLPGCRGLAAQRRSESVCAPESPAFGKVRRPKTDAALWFFAPNPSRKFMPRIASCVNRFGTRESCI